MTEYSTMSNTGLNRLIAERLGYRLYSRSGRYMIIAPHKEVYTDAIYDLMWQAGIKFNSEGMAWDSLQFTDSVDECIDLLFQMNGVLQYDYLSHKWRADYTIPDFGRPVDECKGYALHD